MLDLNMILLGCVALSSVLVLVALVRASWAQNRNWVAVLLLVLATAGTGLLLFPAYAGYAAFTLWLVLYLVPVLGMRLLLRAVLGQRYCTARRLALVLRWLHPTDGWWQQPELFSALLAAEQGDIAAASATLQRHKGTRGPLSQTAHVLLFRIAADWPGLRDWLEREVPPASLGSDITLALNNLRALGETGDLNRLVRFFEEASPLLDRAGLEPYRHLALLHVFAFCGERTEVRRLLEGPLRALSLHARGLWAATAEGAAGQTDVMCRELQKLLASADPLTRRSIEARLARPLASPTAVLTPQDRTILLGLQQRLDQDECYAHRAGFAHGQPLVTYVVLALNLLVFGLELARGGSTDPRTLIDLGALIPGAFAPTGLWRLVAFNLLHFGWAHLILNMLAILVIGPFLEHAVGRARYLTIYIASGVAGGLVILLMAQLRPASQPQVVVGASGCLMGLLGGTAVVLLRGGWLEQSRLAWRRLVWIIVVFAVQVVFDLLTPQVSFTAHLSGFVAGLAVTGLMRHRVAPKRSQADGEQVLPP
jgi:rhomboid protease GluP